MTLTQDLGKIQDDLQKLILFSTEWKRIRQFGI